MFKFPENDNSALNFKIKVTNMYQITLN